MFIIIMGVSRSGKTTICRILAKQSGWPFYNSGEYPSPEEIAKMASGIPFNDEVRAALLSEITNAYRRNPELPNLHLDEAFTQAVVTCQAAWREVMQTAVGLGIPMLVTSVSLAYFNAYRSGVLPANLTHAQRDYFGAYTYRMVDREGVFHIKREG